MSTGTPTSDCPELLGSLTTQQQQRTSARVIKKLRLDDAADRERKEAQECDTAQKVKEEEKDPLKINTVKQRMPKAIWLTEEKNLFFEALNEYGKDFDALTAHICAKMKKKGVPESMLKTKSQVSHFYYRTWHKLSKHVHFDENVKKVAQELYALINYGELRKKVSSVKEKTCARLGELVSRGSLVVRARGRSLRVRTPPCRALRRLNQITERGAGWRVLGPVLVVLSARDAAQWCRVQMSAHNPRAAVRAALRTSLAALLHALEVRWAVTRLSKDLRTQETENSLEENKEETRDPDKHLQIADRLVFQDKKHSKTLALHVGPSPKTQIHIPTLTGSEQVSSQKICFASYLERIGKDKEGLQPKIRTPKRQRKDSTTEKDKEVEHKKCKMDDSEPKLMNIDETAIDGIELMANIKHLQYEDEKPSTEDEKETKHVENNEETETEDRDKYMSERADSLSELDDDEKYNKTDSDNESDQGKEKCERRKFKNLKVKFRIRSKKRGGSIYTLVSDAKDQEDQTKTQEEQVKLIDDQTKSLEGEPKLLGDQMQMSEDQMKMQEDLLKPEDQVKSQEEDKPDIDVEFVTKQIRRGWSKMDAGNLTIGDLYLMFGCRSKLELDYWWAEPTSPLPQPQKLKQTEERKDKSDKTPEKGTDSSLDEEKEKRESDTDLFSPKNHYSQDSNDGLSGDEKKNEQMLSPEQKYGSFPLASKLVNRPEPTDLNQQHLSIMTDKLKRLLALAGNPHILSGTNSQNLMGKCNCGHICTQNKKKPPEKQQQPTVYEANAQIFRHPTPIAPKPQNELQKTIVTNDLPRHSTRRGRPRADSRVVVQRLLPLLPKLPPTHNLIPVKLLSTMPPQPPKILPKPIQSMNPASDYSHVYVLSELNGQFYFHDGDRRIPITPMGQDDVGDADKDETDCLTKVVMQRRQDVSESDSVTKDLQIKTDESEDLKPGSSTDLTGFLPSESMSLSPSRLLRDSTGTWLDGSQDFSLSSLLGHLEGRELPVDSQLQSLMVESSVDYVAKFADLAAEVTNENGSNGPLTDI